MNSYSCFSPPPESTVFLKKCVSKTCLSMSLPLRQYHVLAEDLWPIFCTFSTPITVPESPKRRSHSFSPNYPFFFSPLPLLDFSSLYFACISFALPLSCCSCISGSISISVSFSHRSLFLQMGEPAPLFSLQFFVESSLLTPVYKREALVEDSVTRSFADSAGSLRSSTL